MTHIEKKIKIGTAHALISRRCVNNCVFCAVAAKRKKRQFPKKKDIIDFLEKCSYAGISHMIFSGLGEPTLDKYFEEYLTIANNLKFNNICLFTNGYGLTAQKALRWKKTGLSEILLSIHGMENSHNKNVQRKGSFKEAIFALNTYADLNYSVSVNTCLTRYNLKEIPDLIKFLTKYPIKKHTLSFPEWNGNANYYTDCLPDYEEVSAMADKLIPHDDRITFFDNIPYCLVQKKIREMCDLSPVQYLDGRTDAVVFPNTEKLYPQNCLDKKCQLLSICPGFEKNYIHARGWGSIKQKIDLHLTSIKSIEQLHKDDLTVIVKPTNRCNGACIYCSSDKANFSFDMNEVFLKKMHKELVKYAEYLKIKNITMLWHGGEPLLMGKNFYRKAWSTDLNNKNIQFKHKIQTNLLNIDKEWIELFKQFDVKVSTSVDPIEQIRIYKNGCLQYPDWIENFSLVCDAKLKVGIVFTVVANHLNKIDEIYTFFKNLQSFSSESIGIRFNPVYRSGRAILEGSSLILKPSDFGLFLLRIWELWKKDGSPFPISPFNEWFNQKQVSCEFSGNCHEYFLSIDGEGNIYHCGRFLDSGITLGNILKGEALSSIISNNPWRKKLCNRTETLLSGYCKDCSIWKYCKGGCPYFANLYYNDILKPSPICEANKIFFSSLELKGENCNDSVS
ncbi:radical SAM protein [Candidatus Poribacteria bacterium]|nr:radical SAM protein [Candidatus Poribacteria bacterium]